jgi:hypothetical protein
MAISLRGRTRNPKKGMVTKKRAEARASGAVAKKMEEGRQTVSGGELNAYLQKNDGGKARNTPTR